MGQLAINFAIAHQQWIYGIAVGFLISNPGTLATWAFNAFVKIPGVGQWIAAHPDQAKAWADGFDKAIDAAIDKYSTTASAPTPPTP